MTPALSVLDLTRKYGTESTADTIGRTVRLAQLSEKLGYQRVWFAEHHNAPGLASGTPDILIAHVANATSTIRLGAGGIMLPNHAPLHISETFRLLEALYPDRIDLGLGRAPGTDQRTAFALRRDPDALAADDYPERLAELLAFESGQFPPTHPFATISPIPSDVALPPIYLLGSSDFSGRLAAQTGLGFSFASHINKPAAIDVMNLYRDQFSPSSWREKPHSILAISVVIGETEDEAIDLSSLVKVGIWRLISGNGMGPSPTLEEARTMTYPPGAELRMGSMLANQFIGTAESVAAEVSAFARDCRADEVMLTTWIPMEEQRAYMLSAFKDAWAAVHDASS